jgi:hypothetical protein
MSGACCDRFFNSSEPLCSELDSFLDYSRGSVSDLMRILCRSSLTDLAHCSSGFRQKTDVEGVLNFA